VILIHLFDVNLKRSLEILKQITQTTTSFPNTEFDIVANPSPFEL